VFDMIAQSAMRLCDGQVSFVFQFDGELLRFAAAHGLTPEGLDAFQRALPRPAGEDTAAGRAILHRVVAHIPDVHADPAYGVLNVAQVVTYQGLVAVPILHDGNPIGAISVGRSHAGPFSETQIALLETFATQSVIAIENVRLFKETREALEQQTATSQVLRVISSSPTDVQPVFDAIAQSARRLCDAA